MIAIVLELPCVTAFVIRVIAAEISDAGAEGAFDTLDGAIGCGRKQSPGTSVGPPFAGPFLITQGSLVQSLGTSVHQDVDLMLEAVHPATYLHLLTYPRLIPL